MLTVEQVMASQKASIETLMGLTSKAFEGVEKIVELNLSASKAAMAESAEHAKAMLSVKDAQELMALQSGLLQPLAEKTAAYSRHLYDITTGSTAEMTKAFEGQAAETQKKLMSLVEEATKNAPAGSENAVAMLKSAIGNANAGYEQFSKTSKQAVEAIEANLTSAVNQFTQAAEKVVPRTAAK